MTILTFATASILTAAGVPAHAADTAKSAPDAVKQFIDEAARGGMAEVELGKLTKTHAQSAKVKEFGQRMVTDHGKANAELKKLAAKKGVALPDDLGAEHEAMRDRLAAMKGNEFDRAYLDAMKEDHHKDIDAFKQAADSSPDADVRAFAKRTLPTLEAHARLLDQIEPTVGSAPAPRRAAR
jgi:putative membrane protein